MRWLKGSVLAAVAVAALSLAQTSTEFITPAVKRVGVRLACLCAACKNTVADCPMLQCEYSHPARQRIAAQLAQGKSDDEIVKSFIDQQGLQALAVPPNRGFNSLVWIMPWIAVAAGLGLVWLFIRRHSSKTAPASGPPLDPAVVERYRANIEKDLEKLD
jgi:cytochrome c-type biogenesis protein CcmH/NrfF